MDLTNTCEAVRECMLTFYLVKRKDSTAEGGGGGQR